MLGTKNKITITDYNIDVNNPKNTCQRLLIINYPAVCRRPVVVL